MGPDIVADAAGLEGAAQSPQAVFFFVDDRLPAVEMGEREGGEAAAEDADRFLVHNISVVGQP